MNLPDLIKALKSPAAYPFEVESVEFRQTHISAVFLVGGLVYKVKKPLNLGFLDFSTLERRRHFCEQEVLLNRRLARQVYLDVVPITFHDGQVRVEGDGEVIEWAVKMRRLPDSATLQARLVAGQADLGEIDRLARRLAEFHATAARSEAISAYGAWPVVAGNARENFQQSLPEVGTTVHPHVFERCRQRTEEMLDALKPLISERASRGVPCDTHGDLHLDHVYLFDAPPPDDVVIVDCIEFNERFRYADPVADAAFLVMDLSAHHRRDLADEFTRRYLDAARDHDGRALVPFYTAYRAVVRAKVEGIKLREREVPEEEKQRDLVKARRHWLLALGELEVSSRRPVLVLIGGLPGSGKSTLARELADRSSFTVLRSDVIRKELAQAASQLEGPSPFGEGIYSPEWTERTYQECERRADELLFAGQRVIVDATFGDDRQRQRFIELSRRWCVPVLWLECHVDAEAARRRLEARRGDASDADWSIRERLAERWESPGTLTKHVHRVVRTEGSIESAVTQAQRALAEIGCHSA